MLSELTTDIQYPNFPTYSAHFNYDAYDRVTSMTDKSGARSYTYDDLDIVGSVTTTYTGLPARTVSYSYNTDGSLASIGTPVGAFTYAYDDLGRTTALTNPFMETFSWIYGNDYSLSSQILKNAAGTVIAQTDYAYDNRGYLVALTNKQADGTTLSGFSGPNGALQYDTAGNLTSLTATIPGAPTLSGTTTNTYDWQNQLLNEQTTRNGGYNYSFAYDLAGNPTSFKGQTRGFNDQNQNTAFTFDLNGDPTSYRGNTLTYDPSDHLTGFGGLFTAGYGIGGHRVWKEYNGSRTYFLYADGVPICEMDSAGNVIATNTFGVNGLLNRHDGSGTAFYTFDPQGNVVQQLNSMGTVTSTSMYDAFGSRLTTTPVSPFGYGGQSGYYTDPETGLLLLTHRYYDPTEGRFLTRDPIGWAGGINLYAYCGNEPITWCDPGGLKALTREQYDKIQEMLKYERQHGTLAACERYNNTWGDDPMGQDLFANQPIPTPMGDIDLDWYTTLIACAHGAIANQQLVIPGYVGAKVIWNAKRLSDPNDPENPHQWVSPFADPKEKVAVAAVAEGKSLNDLLGGLRPGPDARQRTPGDVACKKR